MPQELAPVGCLLVASRQSYLELTVFPKFCLCICQNNSSYLRPTVFWSSKSGFNCPKYFIFPYHLRSVSCLITNNPRTSLTYDMLDYDALSYLASSMHCHWIYRRHWHPDCHHDDGRAIQNDTSISDKKVGGIEPWFFWFFMNLSALQGNSYGPPACFIFHIKWHVDCVSIDRVRDETLLKIVCSLCAIIRLALVSCMSYIQTRPNPNYVHFHQFASNPSSTMYLALHFAVPRCE